MESTRIYILLCIHVAFVAAVVTADQDKIECPGPLVYYKDLGCTPIYEKGKDICAVRFDCNHIKKRSIYKCYINGHVYKVNELLTSEDANVCDILCLCKHAYVKGEIAAFRCIEDFACPTMKNAKKGCYLRRNITKCCKDSKEICPKRPENRPVCNVNGTKYLDGEYFSVDGEPDMVCICQPGYRGKNVPPFCIKPNHSPCHHPAFSHIDYFRRNCAPVYYDYSKMKSCYMKMKCQEPNDVVIPRQYPFKMDDNFNNLCTFGNMMMHIGDRLRPIIDNVSPCIDCICEVPPVLTCRYKGKNECEDIIS